MDAVPWITYDTSCRGNTLTHHEPCQHIIENVKSDTKPSYITLLGKRSKAVLLAHLLGKAADVPVHKQVYLWCSPRLRSGTTPIVVIDCNIQNTNAPDPNPIRQTRNATVLTISNTNNIGATLCGNIFSLFSSVVCCFVDDFGGLAAVADWLAEQLVAMPASDLRTVPRILLVMEISSDSFDESIAANKAKSLIINALEGKKGYLNAQRDIKLRLGEINVLGLRSSKSTAVCARSLKRRLLALSQTAMRERANSHIQFSFSHFRNISLEILRWLCGDCPKPFSLVDATRPLGFSCDLLQHCIEDFLKQMPSQAWLWHFAAPLIASALLLASYPPRAHDYLFENIYSEPCRTAISSYTPFAGIQKKFVAAILCEFRAMFTDYKVNGLPSRDNHRKTLTLHHTHLAEFRSHQSCFSCFMRMPEKVLPCGHALCDACIRTLGIRSRFEKNTYDIPECVLCGVNYRNSTFRFVPPTAGIRILSIDGGGVRGVIPLAFLKHIDSLLAPLCCSVKDQFDFVCGTSAGGLVVIGMFLLQWSASESLERFEDVASKTFGRRKALVTRAFQLIMGYVQDGQYSLAAIQDAFRKAFNSPLQMFNPLKNDTKVAVTTTTVKDSLPWLFTNYNGGKRSNNIGYDVIRADRADSDITVSDAACCTSAAPWFFKPQVVGSLGAFQDGGLQHNNPASIAQWEMQFLWPNKPQPDFALSLGTGTSSPTVVSKSPTISRFYIRLFKSFMRNLDGEDAWKRFLNSISPNVRQRFHRLNIRLAGPEPSLDDTFVIPELKSKVAQTIDEDRPRISSIFDSMIASIFYFELDNLPTLGNTGYDCSGFIFCRLDIPPDNLRYLYNRLLTTDSWFLIQGTPVSCVQNGYVPKSLPPFRRHISFQVETLEEMLTISIRGIISKPLLISGFPTTIQKLIEAQQLDSPYGTVDHVDQKPLPTIPRKRSAKSPHWITRGMKRACI
ncbi:acyl transferase/acyl hydrolase/lysophospholipase [Bipolaris maydis]|nr:acyl transferase/acyl hydrolase/lysophospholipase [Bipolaris maydis]KAJ5055081.1 acyl transferase/acyl hydrolase/lysophospholipase [Bipolaris maydis]